jgi:hypothetical protein
MTATLERVRYPAQPQPEVMWRTRNLRRRRRNLRRRT